MPANVIKSDAKNYKGLGIKGAENRWENAKKAAEDQGQKNNYPYIMSIYQKMTQKYKNENYNTDYTDYFEPVNKFKNKFSNVDDFLQHMTGSRAISTPIAALLASGDIIIKPKKRREEKYEDVKIPPDFDNLFKQAFEYYENRKPQKIVGGLGDNRKPSDFNYEQLYMGTRVELEHTTDVFKAMEISMDHLSEFPNYYTLLDNMEKEAEKQLKNTNNKMENRQNLRKYILESTKLLTEDPLSRNLYKSLKRLDSKKTRDRVMQSIMKSQQAQAAKAFGMM